MSKRRKFVYYSLCVFILFIISSCFVEKEATKDENKDIRKIMRDGYFLYRNCFSDALIDKSEDSKSIIYTIKLKAEDEYEYNIVKAKFSKEKTTFYREVEYDLSLSQKNGNLEYSGAFITEDSIESYICSDIINKLVASTQDVNKVVLNKKRLDPNSVFNASALF